MGATFRPLRSLLSPRHRHGACFPSAVTRARGRQAPGGTLDVALEGLLRGAAGHVDPAVRRMCLQALRRLLADIAAASQPPAGFQQCAARARLRGLLCCSRRACCC